MKNNRIFLCSPINKIGKGGRLKKLEVGNAR